MTKLIGTAPYQVPTNADLGTMAFQDSKGVSIAGGNITVTNVTAGNIVVTSPIVYTLPGTVTQLTSKSTGVELNKTFGAITLSNAALAAGDTVSFTLTNGLITAQTVVMLGIAGGGTVGSYVVGTSSITAGSCSIFIHNQSTTSRSEAVVINFALIRAV